MNRDILFRAMLVISLLLTGACTSTFPESIAEEVIIKHFEKRHYKVIELSIGDISPVPMGEKQYMGTEGHIVSVTALTLEFTRDLGEPWNYKKGQHQTFHNARVRIKERTGQRREWIIADIEGIPLP